MLNYTTGQRMTMNGIRYAVAGTDFELQLIALSNLDHFYSKRRACKPIVFSFAEIQDAYNRKRLVCTPTPAFYLDVAYLHKISNQSASAVSGKPMLNSEYARIENAYNLVKDFVENKDLKNGYLFKGLIATEYFTERGIDEYTFYTTLYKYFALGPSKLAFRDRYKNCEAPASSAPKLRKKAGPCLSLLAAETGRLPYKGIDECPFERDKIKKAVAPYISKQRYTAYDLYIVYLKECYCKTDVEEIIDVNTGEVIPLKQYSLAPRSEFISLRSFRYHLKLLYPKLELLTQRRGKSFVRNNVIEASGSESYGVYYATQMYQIDSTVISAYLALIKNLDLEASSKPNFYLVGDVCTSMLTGYHLGMSDPSGSAVREALYNCSIDKVAYCASKGVKISAEDWPCHHIPSHFICDNGSEYTSELYKENLKAIGIDSVTYARSNTGKDKGMIEALIDVIQERATRALSGTVHPDAPVEAEMPVKGAKHTIDELHRIIISEILRYNNAVARDQHSDRELILQQKSATARELFVRSTTKFKPYLSVKTPAEVRFALLPRGKARLTNVGIRFQRLKYTSDNEYVSSLMTNASPHINGPTDVDVIFSQNSTKKIWLISPDPKMPEPFELNLASEDRPYADFCFPSVKDNTDRLKEDLRVRDQEKLSASLANEMDHQEVVSAAKSRKLKSVKNVKANKVAQKKEEREAGSRVDNYAISALFPVGSQSVEAVRETDLIDLFHSSIEES